MPEPFEPSVNSALTERAVVAARSALESEIAALNGLLARLDLQIERSLMLLLHCKGRVVVTGIGKSGLVGAKISATLSSTGTPSFFMHSTEALHGDAGAVLPGDVLLAISNSGETAEVCALAQMMGDRGVPVLAMTGKPNSALAKTADVLLDIAISHEADPLNLAPTTSTTLTLALGDSLACALMAARNFTAQDFARHHPSGALGKRLWTPGTSPVQL